MNFTFLYRLIILLVIISVTFLFGNDPDSKKEALLVQYGSIIGKVIDYSNNEPLVGVNIIILNSTLGASTDQNGEFEIKDVPIGKSITWDDLIEK